MAAPTGTLVIVNLVGGVDGLSVLVPHGDPGYTRRRPRLAVGAPDERYGAIDLGRGLGLHPALAPLQATFGPTDRLAVIGGVGVPDGLGGERGHLPSREYVDRGGRDERDGWAARLLRFEGMGPEAVWSFGPGPHPIFDGILDGLVEPVPVARPPVALAARANALAPPVARRASAVPRSVPVRWSENEWTSAADRLARGYPEGRLSRSLAATADMIRADSTVRIVAIDHPGYDTHVDQGDGRSGVLTHKLDRLARSIAAFWADVVEGRGADEDHVGDPVTIVVVSEFGRAIDENDSGGTEHGRGGVALALGDQVVGGVHGDLPVLSSEHDAWPVTIDVRRVLADAAASHGFRPWRAGTFPQLSLPNRSLGLLLST